MKIKKSTTITLTLNEEEAAWLKSIMQNPICKDESVTDSEMRRNFWDVLTFEGVK